MKNLPHNHKKVQRRIQLICLSFGIWCSNILQAAGPAITAGPVSQTVNPGQNVTFSVSATGSLLSYQWLKGGAPISGATSSTLTLTNVKNSDAYPYAVKVSNSQGVVITDPANLIVVDNTNPGGSSIFLSPKSKGVPQGTSVSWSVSYQAQRYTWRKNGSTVRDDWQGGYWSGVWPTTSSTYSINLATASDAGDYDVVVEVAGTGQQIVSTLSTLVVNVPDAPSILSQPSSGYVGAGNPLNLSVTATGAGTLLYQWYKNGVLIPGANYSNYSISVAETSDAGVYEVLVSNSLGSADSAQANIIVLERPQLSPATKSVSQGGSVSWSLTTTNADRFTWRKNGSAVWTDYQWGYGGWSGVVGGTTSTYTINPALSSHAGTYDVVVHRVNENVDVVSTPSVLTVSVPNEPYITQQPANVSSSVGSSAQFTVSATGAEPLKYQWYKNGAKISSATNSTLTITNAQAADALKYNVVMSNSYGSITSSIATLTLESTLPGATLTPSSRAVPEGVLVSWNYGVNNGSVYTWRKNGVTVWQDNKGSGWSGVLGWTSSTYTIPSTQLSDAGDYDVVVQFLYGSTQTSSTSTLAVTTLTAEDSDQDGVSDLMEILDGTNPLDASSYNAYSIGIVAYYPFNGNCEDESGNGNDGVNSGAALVADRFGQSNKAYYFDGSSAYIDIGVKPLLDFAPPQNDFSISVWVKPEIGCTEKYIIYSFPDQNPSSNMGFGIGTTGGYGPYAFLTTTQDNSSVGDKPELSNTMADGVFHHLVATFKRGDSLKTYLDGQQLNSVSLVGNTAALSDQNRILIGARNMLPSQGFKGVIDDIRIYKRALSVADVGSLYEQEVGNLDSNNDGVTDKSAVAYGIKPSVNLSSLLSNPPAGFYSQIQYAANRDAGRADVTNNPNAYSLYKTDQIHNMRMGGMVLSRSNNQLNLNYEIQQSPDLSSWSSYLNQTVTITNAPTNKMFLRILPKQ